MRYLAAVLLLYVGGVGQAGEKEVVGRLEKAGVMQVGSACYTKTVPAVLYGPYKTLVFWDLSGTDAFVGELRELESFQGLDLSHSDVTDAGMSAVSRLKWVRSLSLRSVATDTRLRRLQCLDRLEILSLSDNPKVTDAGLRRLEELTSLKILYLEDCPGVTDEGVARLRKALPGCNIVR